MSKILEGAMEELELARRMVERYKINGIRNTLAEQMGSYLSDYLILNQDSIEKPDEDELNHPSYGYIMQRISKGIEDPRIIHQLAHIITSVDFSSFTPREITITLPPEFEDLYKQYNETKPVAHATSRLFFGVPLEADFPWLWNGKTIRFTIPPYETEAMIRNMEKVIDDFEEKDRRKIIECLSKFYDFHLKVEERIQELAKGDNKPTIHDFVTPEIVEMARESRDGSSLIIANEIYTSAENHFRNAIFKPKEYIREAIGWRDALMDIVAILNKEVPKAYNSLL